MDESPYEVPRDFTKSLFSIDGYVTVITGAGSGLGAAMAVGLAQSGSHVVLADINTEGAEKTEARILSEGGSCQVEKLNVTSSVDVENLAQKIKGEHGRVDVLINSAGSAFRAPAEEFPEEKFDFIINLNLKGTYLSCQSFGRLMLAQGKGSIINIASIGGFNAYPWASAYLASKGGVVQVTRSLALEWRSRGVRVNGIGPTLMGTPLITDMDRANTITSDFIKARMIRPRLGLARELIGAAIFLASDASSLVTGHTLMCDDGYTAV